VVGVALKILMNNGPGEEGLKPPYSFEGRRPKERSNGLQEYGWHPIGSYSIAPPNPLKADVQWNALTVFKNMEDIQWDAQYPIL
jgi:hypothetical protein